MKHHRRACNIKKKSHFGITANSGVTRDIFAFYYSFISLQYLDIIKYILEYLECALYYIFLLCMYLQNNCLDGIVAIVNSYSLTKVLKSSSLFKQYTSDSYDLKDSTINGTTTKPSPRFISLSYQLIWKIINIVLFGILSGFDYEHW